MRGSLDDLAAWACVGLLLGLVAVRSATSAAPFPAPALRAARAPDPDAWNARELRALPGIGPVRALAIVRARWEGLRGGPSAWRAIPGIGPATAAAADATLREGFVEPARERAYTPPGSP